jgi:hypothetical protein
MDGEGRRRGIKGFLCLKDVIRHYDDNPLGSFSFPLSSVCIPQFVSAPQCGAESLVNERSTYHKP